MPPELIEALDENHAELGYKHRSTLVQALVVEGLQRHDVDLDEIQGVEPDF